MVEKCFLLCPFYKILIKAPFTHQSVPVTELVFIAFCDTVVVLFYHQLRYGEPTLRRAVPLALALISVSNPRLNILDTLSKFSHDADPEVSYNSIFAMGMVGSGEYQSEKDLKQLGGRFEAPFSSCCNA